MKLRKREEGSLGCYLPIIRSSAHYEGFCITDVKHGQFHFYINSKLLYLEGCFLIFKFLKEPPFRYFIQQILLTRCFLSTNNYQTSFPPIAIFAKPGSRICNPPSVTGILRMYQLTRCKLF